MKLIRTQFRLEIRTETGSRLNLVLNPSQASRTALI